MKAVCFVVKRKMYRGKMRASQNNYIWKEKGRRTHYFVVVFLPRDELSPIDT